MNSVDPQAGLPATHPEEQQSTETQPLTASAAIPGDEASEDQPAAQDWQNMTLEERIRHRLTLPFFPYPYEDRSRDSGEPHAVSYRDFPELADVESELDGESNVELDSDSVDPNANNDPDFNNLIQTQHNAREFSLWTQSLRDLVHAAQRPLLNREDVARRSSGVAEDDSHGTVLSTLTQLEQAIENPPPEQENGAWARAQVRIGLLQDEQAARISEVEDYRDRLRHFQQVASDATESAAAAQRVNIALTTELHMARQERDSANIDRGRAFSEQDRLAYREEQRLARESLARPGVSGAQLSDELDAARAEIGRLEDALHTAENERDIARNQRDGLRDRGLSQQSRGSQEPTIGVGPRVHDTHQVPASADAVDNSPESVQLTQRELRDVTASLLRAQEQLATMTSERNIALEQLTGMRADRDALRIALAERTASLDIARRELDAARHEVQTLRERLEEEVRRLDRILRAGEDAVAQANARCAEEKRRLEAEWEEEKRRFEAEAEECDEIKKQLRDNIETLNALLAKSEGGKSKDYSQEKAERDRDDSRKDHDKLKAQYEELQAAFAMLRRERHKTLDNEGLQMPREIQTRREPRRADQPATNEAKEQDILSRLHDALSKVNETRLDLSHYQDSNEHLTRQIRDLQAERQMLLDANSHILKRVWQWDRIIHDLTLVRHRLRAEVIRRGGGYVGDEGAVDGELIEGEEGIAAVENPAPAPNNWRLAGALERLTRSTSANASPALQDEDGAGVDEPDQEQYVLYELFERGGALSETCRP